MQTYFLDMVDDYHDFDFIQTHISRALDRKYEYVELFFDNRQYYAIFYTGRKPSLTKMINLLKDHHIRQEFIDEAIRVWKGE